MRVKEGSEKADLRLNIQKIKIRAFSPVTSWQIEEGKVKTVTDFIFLGFKITADGEQPRNQKAFVSWKKSYGKPRVGIKKQRHHLVDKAPNS